MTVNTSKVEGRRALHFNNVGEILADAEQLASGKIKALGNWSPGQIFQHVATVMKGSLDGPPFRLNWFYRLIGKFMKGRALRGPMPPGFNLPKVASDAIVAPATTSTEEGLAALRTVVHRLQNETVRAPNPFLGPMTVEEWDQLHCRHSELHLSFLVPLEEG